MAEIETRAYDVAPPLSLAELQEHLGRLAYESELHAFGEMRDRVQERIRDSHIGIPIAATGVALTAALYFIQRQRATDNIRAQAKAYLGDCTEAFLRDVVHKQFFPELRQVN